MIDTMFARRDFMQFLGWNALALGVTGPTTSVLAQPKSAQPLAPLNRFPRTVQEYFVEQVRQVERAANASRARLKTKADAEAYVKSVRERIMSCFGPFPEKTPLNPRVTGKLERDAYTVEKVIFESRPGFLVTANLYIPKGITKPRPGVVGSCGHSANGKAAEAYQGFAQGLARLGYVCLIFDPIGQGERVQYGHVEKEHRPGVGVGEHLLAGNQQFLVGEFLGTWRAWDGIRALDYLLTRPEVDPKQVGITGNSGGGTMTTWLCGVEQRWSMGAPSCFVTTFRRNLENELPADTEQCPPRALALGLDHSDFIAAMAPKPVILLAKEKDYFDARGSEEAFARLKQLYTLLGAEENIRLFIGPTTHGYSQENREAMYQWFNKVTQISDAQTEPALTIEKDEDLYCTPKGQVAEQDSRSVMSFTQEKAKALEAKRGKPTGRALNQKVVNALNLRLQPGVPEYRILRVIGNRGYPTKAFTTYAVETERNAFAIVYRLANERLDSRPTKTKAPAVLYVSHLSSDAELREEAFLRDMISKDPNATFYTCDVRGIGESRPDTCGTNSFLSPYGCDYFYAIHSLMLGRPYVGQKTFDVLRVINWLSSHGHQGIHLVANGWGTLPATFAALLSDRVTQVTLVNAMTSYGDIAKAEHYKWPLSTFVPGVLESFDLPDCYTALQAKKLAMIDPWNPDQKV